MKKIFFFIVLVFILFPVKSFAQVNPEDLILHMDFESLVDTTGENTITVNGTDRTIDSDVCSPEDKCYNVGFSNNTLDLGSPLLTDNPNWTISFDAYIPTGSTNYVSFVSQYIDSTSGRFFVGKQMQSLTQRDVVRVGGNVLSSSYTYGSNPEYFDTWRHWVLSKNDTNYILTIDGVEIFEGVLAENILTTRNTHIGLPGTPNSSTGYINNLFIFDTPYTYEDVDNFTSDYIPETPEPGDEISLTLTNPSNHQIFQRDSDNESLIAVSGYVEDASEPVTIEWNYDGSTYQECQSNVTTNFSCSFIAPVGMETLSVRVQGFPDIEQSITTGVGDLYLLIGQSNQDGRANTRNNIVTHNGIYGTMFQQEDRCTYYVTSNPVVGAWKVNNDPTGNGNASGCGNYGSQWPLIANSLIEEFEVPIAWITGTYGGVSITTFQKGQRNYDRALELVNQATNGQNIIKGILWHQGENDSSQTQEWYYQLFENLYNSLEQDIDFEKMMVAIVALNNGYGGGNADGVQRAQYQAISNLSKVVQGPESYDIAKSVDQLHYKTDEELGEFARRWEIHIAKEFYNTDVEYPTLESWYLYDTNIIALRVNEPVEISNWELNEGVKAFSFIINNDGNIISDYTTSLVNEGSHQLVLVDIGEAVVEDELTLSYATTNTGYDTDVLRSVDSHLSVNRNYDIPYVLNELESYTLSFDEQGGSLVDDKEEVEGTIITLPVSSRSGFTFIEWNTQSDGLGIRYEAGDSYTFGNSDTVLYAIWEEDIDDGDSSLHNEDTKTRVIGTRKATPSILDVVPPQVCSQERFLTQNLKAGARDGKYHAYTYAIVTEVKLLQAHMNRLGFNSGPEDGILGPLTDAAIKRMQVFLGTTPDGYVGPLTRALINMSC